jgi:hypothetical protein
MAAHTGKNGFFTNCRSMVTSALVLGAILSPAAQAITLGQVDTFSSGVQDWYTVRGGPYYPPPGPPDPPQVQPSGGPAGIDDAYLEVTLSIPQSGKPTQAGLVNSSQWAGDYQSAGVTGIEMDLINLGNYDLTFGGNFDLPIRLVAGAFVSDVVWLPAGGPWTHVSFAFGSGDLVDHVARLDLTHTSFAGELQLTVLGVDNVRAVPEPATIALMLCGLAAMLLRVARTSTRRVGVRVVA